MIAFYPIVIGSVLVAGSVHGQHLVLAIPRLVQVLGQFSQRSRRHRRLTM